VGGFAGSAQPDRQEDQAARDFAGRVISPMFMLASSPIEKTATRGAFSGEVLGNLRQTPKQGKRGSHPLAVSKGLFRTAIVPSGGRGTALT
jgi:hypothetical protein